VDKNSNGYILIYAATLTVVVAVLLSLLSELLKEPQARNELLAKKTDILRSVGKAEEKDIEAYFSERIEGKVIGGDGTEIEGVDALSIDLVSESRKPIDQRRKPYFIFKDEDGSQKYILPMRGQGLWGPIWGYMAFESDYNTIAGVSFDHATETPGLGAEIKQSWFQESFEGLKVYRGDEFVGIEVRKGELRRPEHQVQAISGSTITGNGVSEMIKREVGAYMSYFRNENTN
jgi:Na+-transporting NADH:ubiquinone oxidoreductase subunit C